MMTGDDDRCHYSKVEGLPAVEIVETFVAKVLSSTEVIPSGCVTITSTSVVT